MLWLRLKNYGYGNPQSIRSDLAPPIALGEAGGKGYSDPKTDRSSLTSIFALFSLRAKEKV